MDDEKAEKKEKLPIDARLLSQAVIELNISRRSIGMYPPGHPIVNKSIERAFLYLSKIFELRSAITLGVTESSLVIDENTLDRKNPVFKEFTSVLHSKGIVAITFNSMLTKDELTGLHEILTDREVSAVGGKELLELLKEKNIRNIVLNVIELSKLSFSKDAHLGGAEGARRDVWEDYVYGLIEGKLPEGHEDEITAIPPMKMAYLINESMDEDTPDDAYDRVISNYIRKKGETRLSTESKRKLVSFMDGLKPELKVQFLSTSFRKFSMGTDEMEKVVGEMTPESFNRIVDLLGKQSSAIPETLRNLIEKLSAVKQERGFGFDFQTGVGAGSAVMDDIEIGEEIVGLFEDDHFKSYVTESYHQDILAMASRDIKSSGVNLASLDCDLVQEVIDRGVTDVILELLEWDMVSDEEFLEHITTLTKYAERFIETGNFEAVLEIHNALYSHYLDNKKYALSALEYFFHSEAFIDKLIESFRRWGRRDREGAVRLVRVLRSHLTEPLLDALTEETDSSTRKYIIYVLSGAGSDVAEHAVKRLRDERWYVVRNMVYLIRECNGRQYAGEIIKYAKHKNVKVRLEALRTLLYFNTPESVPFLKLFLKSNDRELCQGAIKLAGAFEAREAVPVLVGMLQRRDLLGTRSYYKMEAVNVLGKLGDPEALGALLGVVNSRSIFYGDDLMELKTAIYRTLDNYPLESIVKLVENGLKSKNDEIRSISEAMVKKYNE